MTAIQLQEVTKIYRKRTVLQKVHCEVKANTLTGIIGRNGVGKTTLMKMIAGYTPLDEGTIEVFGENPFNNLKIASNLIFIDDSMTFPLNMTTRDILKACAQFYFRWDNEFAIRLMEHFQIPLQLKPHHLSKGKQSTFFAIVGLASRSPLTIFDEPTNGMDSVVRKDFYRALLKDYIDHPRTILLSSHHIEEIEHLLEEVVLIHDKEILFQGAIDDLQRMFLSLTASETAIAQFISADQIVTSQPMGPYQTVTVENQFSIDEMNEMKHAGIKMANLGANDAYIALTSRAEGGIDDVFK